MSEGAPKRIELNEVGEQSVTETLRLANIAKTDGTPTKEDLLKDDDWVELFNSGYVYVGNIDDDMLNTVRGGGGISDSRPGSIGGDEISWWKNCWFFKDGVETKTTTGYEYGNPSKPKLGYNSSALFAKKF